MVKEWLKKSFIWKLKNWIFETLYYPHHLLVCSQIKNSKDYLLLVGTPLYDNLGDHLIAEKEIEWLRDHYPHKKIIEIPTPAFIRYEAFLAHNVSEHTKVYITGGGWMGDVWPDDEKRMQRMIKCFFNTELTVFPQTVYYELCDDNSKELLTQAIRGYEGCKSLTLCFRDEQSYKFAIKYFGDTGVKIELVPDIALYNLKNTNNPRNRVLGICLRKDRENNRPINVENVICEWADRNNFTQLEYSTITKFYVPKWLRLKIINRLIRKLGSVEIVVTDRLHGMIIALLSGCKCVVLDNKTHKVSGVYRKWLSWNPNVCYIEDPHNVKEITNSLHHLLINEDKISNCPAINLNDYFEAI